MPLVMNWKATVAMTAVYAAAAVAGFLLIKDSLQLQLYLFGVFAAVFIAGTVLSRRR